MPRTKKAEHATASTDVAQEYSPAAARASEGTTATAVLEPPATQVPAEQRVYAADPRPEKTARLTSDPDGPTMELLRSHKFKQMQIKFEGEQPDQQYKEMLEKQGWKDRTESEGVFTKQIDRDQTWQSVQKMEQEFRDVANKIRADRNLAPVLELAA